MTGAEILNAAKRCLRGQREQGCGMKGQRFRFGDIRRMERGCGRTRAAGGDTA